jgi:hypothetical protein
MLTEDEIGEKFDKFIDKGWEENIKGDNEDEPDEIDKKAAIRLARWAYEKGKKDGRLDGITPSLFEEAHAKGKEEGIDAVEKELMKPKHIPCWDKYEELEIKEALAAARRKSP